MKALRLISLCILPLVGCIFLSSAAHAITVSPVIIDQEIAPGMRVNGKLMVTNDGKSPQTYYVSVQTFVPMGEEGEQQYLDETDIKGLPSWFTFSDKAFTLESAKTKEVSYSIIVPPDGEPGGHYAAVFFSTTPEVEKDRTSIGVAAKTGIVFLVDVSGNVREQADIESFTANQPIYSHLPAMMSLRIRNTGSVHFRPTGTLSIRNMWGGIVARVPANPKQSAVLPNSIRRLDTWWVKSMDLAPGGFWAEVTNEWQNFALGRYVATVDVHYGSQNIPLEARTVSFWVLPWALGLLLLGAIIILLLGMGLYNRLIISMALKRSKK